MQKVWHVRVWDDLTTPRTLSFENEAAAIAACTISQALGFRSNLRTVHRLRWHKGASYRVNPGRRGREDEGKG